MNQEAVIMKFMVLYKLWNHPKPERSDWVAGSVVELLQDLKKEGITKESVDYLYVHYTVPSSQDVVECVAWENTTAGRKVVSLDEARKKKDEKKPEPPNDRRQNLIDAMVERVTTSKKERKGKPHIKLKADTMKPAKPVHYSYLHKAQQV